MRILPILLVPSLLLTAVPAFAQSHNTDGLRANSRGAANRPAAPAPQQPAAALPGLAARTAPAPIPADPNRGELSPNAALFDAITRGDLPAARDAVSRGADLDARNVLGLTPVDAAVDQGRNEIMFYLLSARGTVRSPAAPPQARDTPRERQVRERAEQAQRAAAERAARQAAAAPPPRDAMPASARLFAGDGGTPRPDIGFLGFDAGRPEGAVSPAAERAPRRRGG